MWSKLGDWRNGLFPKRLPVVRNPESMTRCSGDRKGFTHRNKQQTVKHWAIIHTYPHRQTASNLHITKHLNRPGQRRADPWMDWGRNSLHSCCVAKSWLKGGNDLLKWMLEWVPVEYAKQDQKEQSKTKQGISKPGTRCKTKSGWQTTHKRVVMRAWVLWILCNRSKSEIV